MSTVLKDQLYQSYSLVWGRPTAPATWNGLNISSFLEDLKQATKATETPVQPNQAGQTPAEFLVQHIRSTGTKYVYVEISPLCDDSQRKWKQNRLVPGILVPTDRISNTRIGQLEKMESVVLVRGKLALDSREYHLLFDLRYLFSIPAPDLTGVESMSALGLEQLLYIQNKHTSFQARPGVVIIE